MAKRTVDYIRGWARVRGNNNIYVNTSTGETIDKVAYEALVAERKAIRNAPRPRVDAVVTIAQLQAEIEVLRETIAMRDNEIALIMAEKVAEFARGWKSGYKSAIDTMHDKLVEMSNSNA